MDEAVINGANLFFAPQFHIDPNTGNTAQNQWLLGLVNSAPYVRAVPNIWCALADFFYSYAVLFLVAGSPILSTVISVAGAPSSSVPSSHSLPVSGKASLIHGLISSLLALSLGWALAPSHPLFPFMQLSVALPPFAVVSS